MTRAITTVLLCALVACAPYRQAAYGLELEACLEASATCHEYVACRKRVATHYGRVYAAKCKEVSK